MSDVINYRCPSCGGEIGFDGNTQQVTCPYCDTTFELETLKQYEELSCMTKKDEKSFELHQQENLEGVVSYICESCGAQIIGDENTVATSCPYCNSPIVVNDKVSGQLKPDYVIPFQFNKDQIKDKLRVFYQDKPFLPKTFTNDSFIDEIKGIYVPFWTYHCLVDAQMKFRTSKRRYYSSGDYNVTETSYYLSTREGTIGFDHVPVDASLKIEDDSMQSIEPFDFSKRVDFETAYLAGYLADKYDEDEKVSEKKAVRRIETTTKDYFIGTLKGLSLVRIENASMQFYDKEVDYYLLPVWILNLKWQEDVYTLYINGQTGKVIGNLPVDKKAYWAYFMKVYVFAVIIVTLIAIFVLGG